MKVQALSAKEQQLARRGERIYRTRLKKLLEPDQNGMFVAIEVESGDYFLGRDILEALEKARQRHPNKLFHVIRVGYAAAVSLKALYETRWLG